MIEPVNLLIVMSHEYDINAVGYDGHPIVRAPNIDRLTTTFMTARRSA